MQSLIRRIPRTRLSVLRTARPSSSIRFSSSKPTGTQPPPTTTSTSPESSAVPEEEQNVSEEVDVAREEETDLEEGSFPNLMKPDPLMDLHESFVVPPGRHSPYSAKIIVRNDPSMFDAYQEVAEAFDPKLTSEAQEEHDTEEDETKPSRYLSAREIKGLHIYPLLTRYVTQQTGKGKVSRTAYLVVVGDGNGLVGFGEAKGHDRTEVKNKAQENAIRNMDLVERFEQRTLWTDTEAKLGGTKIFIRPRPVGFGLAVNPYIHQVFKAAGIKDASAKVWGSRNPYQVIRLLMRMLHPGSAPSQMGNGIGGSGRRMESGRGMRGRSDLERERGRRFVNLYTTR